MPRHGLPTLPAPAAPAEPWDVPPRTAPAPRAGPEPPDAPGAPVVGVVGGCGGAGASVLAAALARVAGESRRSVLMDLDPLGSGADALFGAEGEPGLRWPDLATVRGPVPGDAVLAQLPVIDDVPVVTWGRDGTTVLPVEAVRCVLDGVAREVDLVVVDLPRATDHVARAATARCDLVLLVVPLDVRAAWAAARVADVVRRSALDVRVVIRGPAPGGLRPGAIAEALGLPIAGVMRPEPRLAAALDRGEPPALRRRGPLAGLCRSLLAGIPLPAAEVP